MQDWIQTTGWRWLLISAMAGYLIVHPSVMILAQLMLRLETNLNATVSIGVAQYSHGENITTLIKRADKNMYAAKKMGKNRIFYRPDHYNFSGPGESI